MRDPAPEFDFGRGHISYLLLVRFVAFCPLSDETFALARGMVSTQEIICSRKARHI